MTKERCKNFKEWEVLAIQDDRKTQFREIVKTCNHPTIFHYAPNDLYPYYFRRKDAVWDSFKTIDELTAKYCPYGKVGDRITGRETWQKLQTWEENGCQFYDLADKSLSYFFEYKATNESNWDGKWKPSIFMPQSACRIVRENIDIRVERVADISEEDAIGEGVELVNDSNCLWKDYELTDGTKRLSARSSYKSLWNSINNNPKLNKKTDTYIVYPFDKQSAAKWGNTYRNKPLIVVPNPWVWVVKFK